MHACQIASAPNGLHWLQQALIRACGKKQCLDPANRRLNKAAKRKLRKSLEGVELDDEATRRQLIEEAELERAKVSTHRLASYPL